MKFERLRSLRERRGISQSRAAKQMGIVRTTYSNYEAGNREPDFETIKKIAEYFEVSIDYLLGRTNTPLEITDNNMDEIKKKMIEEVKTMSDDDVRALLDLAKRIKRSD